MSNENTLVAPAPKAASAPKARQIIATLIRGETFILKDQVFKNGKPQPVTAEVRRYLEEHAIDYRHYPAREPGEEDEVREYQKFEFTTGE
jgi:hypothetical protein